MSHLPAEISSPMSHDEQSLMIQDEHFIPEWIASTEHALGDNVAMSVQMQKLSSMLAIPFLGKCNTITESASLTASSASLHILNFNYAHGSGKSSP